MRQPVSCYDKALDLLSRRSHFRRELAFKLRRREYDDEVIEATLGRLEEKGFLDDLATAREWVASRLSRGPEGRLRLLAGLLRKGASHELAEEALGGLDSEQESELAHQAAERWRLRQGPAEDRSERATLARHLERRGFPGHVIVSVLDSGKGTGGTGLPGLEEPVDSPDE